MKKLILLLLFIPLICFAQSDRVISNEDKYLSDILRKSAAEKYNSQDYNGALNDADMAIVMNPNNVDAYRIRALTKIDLEDYYGAIGDYTKAIELFPSEPSNYVGRGLSKNVLGDEDGACSDFRMAAAMGDTYGIKWSKQYCNGGVDPKTNSNNRISSSNQGNTSTNPKDCNGDGVISYKEKTEGCIKKITNKITGIIWGKNGPLPGATVRVKGTNTGTSTDFDGNFTIKASLGDVLLISFVGFYSAEVTISNDQEQLIVELENCPRLRFGRNCK